MAYKYAKNVKKKPKKEESVWTKIGKNVARDRDSKASKQYEKGRKG